MPEADRILFEVPEAQIARIVLNRPESRNAQDTHLLYELNDAFDRAAADDEIRVIILAAAGPHFSSGHDLRETGHLENLLAHRRVGTWSGFTGKGAEPIVARERELFLGMFERWRSMPKPTIAQVHGRCISGGLMLVWPCDLIVASEDAQFEDNTVDLGVGGVEYFGHPMELGPRKAKEMLFTARSISAHEALQAGMVNRVVPRDQLEGATLELARQIATKSPFVLKLIKEAVNGFEDARGRQVAIGQAFALHQLAHAHNLSVHGIPIDPAGVKLRPQPSPTEE